MISIDDFNVYYTRVIPNNTLEYKTYFNLSGIVIIATIGYNSRVKKRWISLRTNGDVPILKKTFLIPQARIYPNINMHLLGYDYYLTLEPVDPNNISDDFFNWKDKFYITFVGAATEIQDDIDNVYREVVVGN